MSAPRQVLGMPEAEYHARPELNSSTLKYFLKAPALAKDPPTVAPTASMTVGSAVHCLVLEGEEAFEARWKEAPSADRRTKAGKAAWESFNASLAPGVQALTSSQSTQVWDMAKEVWAHRGAMALLDQAPVREVTLFADLCGVPCRARLDAVSPAGFVADLKTCQDASGTAFRRSCQTYGYWLQMAHYTAMAQAVWGIDHAFHFITVEAAPPHSVAIHEIGPITRAAACQCHHDLLLRYWECKASNHWPGIPSSTLEFPIP